MNRHVNAIAGRLSLRPPQRSSLEILDRITEIVPPKKEVDVATAIAAIRSEFATVTDFERDFPSLCFALATGVGKTRLMGAFIGYLHLAHGINNFFVLAPNPTIYNKLVTDFTPNTPKYVFTGIAEFATDPPDIITGDNYEGKAGSLFESQKWLKPAKGQFQIFYKAGNEFPEYIPDFIAETDSCIYMLEPKARNEMTDGEVLPKKDSAIKWCAHAINHNLSNGGKPWRYVLIPHDAIADNMTLPGLVGQFGGKA